MKKLLLLFTLSSSLFTLCEAQFTDLLDFNTTNGANPYSSLIASVTGDTLYGQTTYGGANNAGCIFSIQRNGTGYNDILDFDGTSNGAYPYGALTLSPNGKILYGMTSYGIYGEGNIFSIHTDGTGFTDIHEFSSSDGSTPYGSVTLSATADSLFCLTSTGGNSGYGDIFCVTVDGSEYADLLDFDGTNGAYAYGSLVFSKGYLFGMTSEGGMGFGNIFVFNPHTLANSDLYDFDGYSGYPYGSLTPSVTEDTLFGMSSEQGLAYGNVFAYMLGGGGYEDLYEFTNKDGNLPEGDLTLARSGTGRNLLYGMTSEGGANGEGIIFSIKTNGSRYKDLFDFSNTNGIYPYGSVTYINDTMYGLCSQGGANNEGLVFWYSILEVDSFHVNNLSCINGYLGTATAYPAGGVSPYTYYWTPGGNTTQTVTGLSAGTYTAIVTDNVGSRALSVAVMNGLFIYISEVTNIGCIGGNTGAIQATPSGGTAPYIYSWTGVTSPPPGSGSSGITDAYGSPLVTEQPAGTYTVTVTDSCGNTASVTATITEPPMVSAPTIDAVPRADSVKFTISKPDSTLSYSWSATDVNGRTYSGSAINDTLYLLYYLRGATLTVTATNIGTGCMAANVISIIHPIINNYNPPANLPYPRWSKRGIYLDSANIYITASSTIQNSIAQYVKRNQITYVLLQGLEDFVFGGVTHYLDTTNARYLANFIALLKDSAGVEEIGVECYDEATDSTAWNAGYYDINFVGSSISAFNWNFTPDCKVDVVSMDDEFMYAGSGDSSDAVSAFHNTHMPLLRELYQAAHECPANFLKVEDYLEEPTDPANSIFDVWDPTEVMEKDSIAMYADRILNSCYTAYPNVLFNRGDFVMTYPVFGSDSITGIDSIHKTIELWPSFDPANAVIDSCAYCIDPINGDNFLGDSMCYFNRKPDYMEERYYDSLAFSEKIGKYTDNADAGYSQFPIGGDNNFTIGGSFWFQYHCLQHVQSFDTGAASALKFYVSLGPNIQWYHTGVYIPYPPIMLRAKTHGGTPPFNFIWYDDSDRSVLQSSSSDSLAVHFPYTKRISVLAVDADTLTATDYVNIYQMCNEFPISGPVKHNWGNTQTDSTAAIAPIKIYPNPSNGSFTLEYELAEGETGNLILFNELGGKLGAYQLYASSNKMNISNNSLSNGVYIYQLWVDNKIMQRGKLVVIK